MVQGEEGFCTALVWRVGKCTNMWLRPELKGMGLCLGCSPNKPRISLRGLLLKPGLNSRLSPLLLAQRPAMVAAPMSWDPASPETQPCLPLPLPLPPHLFPLPTYSLTHRILIALPFPYHQAYLPKCCSLCPERFLASLTWLIHLRGQAPVFTLFPPRSLP